MRSVLEQQRTVVVRQLLQRGRVDRVPGVVDTGDDLRALGDLLRDGLGVEVAGVGAHVGEHDLGTLPHCTRGGGEEGERRGDHLVAGLQFERGIRGVQRSGSGRDRDRPMLHCGHLRNIVLEGADGRTGGQPIATHNRGDSLDVAVVDRLLPVRQHHQMPDSSSLRMSSASIQMSFLSEAQWKPSSTGTASFGGS